MRGDIRPQQLVGAEPQQVQQHRVNLIGRPAGRRDDDSVEQSAGAAGAVSQFGGERRVPAGDMPLGEQSGQCQVGVGIALGDRPQHVERSAPRRIQFLPARAPAGAAAAVRPPSLVHDARAPAAKRAPRAQSAADIGFFPGGWISPNWTGSDPVPINTRVRSAAMMPGASGSPDS